MAKKHINIAKMPAAVTGHTSNSGILEGYLDGRTGFEVQSVSDLFNSEAGEGYLPSMLESMAADFSKETGVNITPERIVIAAVHLLLFGDDHSHRAEFLADPTGRKYRTETEEEEEIDRVLLSLDPDLF